MHRSLLATFFCLIFLKIFSQTTAIVLPPTLPEPDQRAARILQFYLKKITAVDVPIVSKETDAPGKSLIFIGKKLPVREMAPNVPKFLPPDAYFLEGKNGHFQITGGGEMGTEYGVYDLLERLGCRKYSPQDSVIPEIKNLRLPELPGRLEIPAFPYRELHYQPAFDEGYARWHRLKTRPQKDREWGMFVHTFDKLCPPEHYFHRNPEFFSWNGRQFSKGQLCLSNDSVLQIVIKTLGKKMAERPDAQIWSVSQNDNFDACRCARCLASDRFYGSPAGTLLAFVNRVAEAFPEKTISTLAYQYTRRAPKSIRPARNVSVCLCSIECNRGLSIEEGCKDFARDVEEWSQLTDNLMIWDYVVQFRDYLSPFPNWHTLQPNLQFFKKNRVKMVFEQGSGGSRSEFSDMRSYLLAKLMWNPELSIDSIVLDFGKAYYGAAQPYIWEYIDSLTTRMLRTDQTVLIYGTPLSAADTWLDERAVNDYYKPLTLATQAVADPSRDADRLSEAMLPMLHVLFEQFKVRDWGYPCPDSTRPGKQRFCYLPEHVGMVEQYPFLLKKFGYETMNENNYKPEKYAADMLHFFNEGRVWHSFMRPIYAPPGTPVPLVQLASPASTTYAKGNADILLDSRRGDEDYRWNWLGFQGNDLDATVYYPENQAVPLVTQVSVQFLQDQQSWVFFPKKVVIEVSEDGKVFKKIKEEQFEIFADGKKSVRRITANLSQPTAVRAVRIRAENLKTCPDWHTCNGEKCWIFVDEVVVD